MAIYRLSADIVRRSAGRTVTAAAAYRAGACITDQRSGIVSDYRPRRGVVHTEIMAPDGAPTWMRDRAALWNGVESIEKRKDAQLARDIELALPHELSPAARLDLVRGFVRTAFVDHGMVADIAIHAPSRDDADHRNHHAHVLLTLRPIDGDGFGNKERSWNQTEQLEQWRDSWEQHVNRALTLAGESVRVDHRSFAAQGIAQLPQPKLSPAVVEMEARGIRTERGNQLREVAAINAARATVSEIEEPAPASPPPITPAPRHDIVTRRSSPHGGIFAAFRSAAREVWGRMRRAARPMLLRRSVQPRPRLG